MFAWHPDGMTRRDRFRGALRRPGRRGRGRHDRRVQAARDLRAGTDMVGGGPFALPAGAWTDDTSMALCLAESLVERRTFDPVDQLRALRCAGTARATGRARDAASTSATRRARRSSASSARGEPYPGDAAPDAAGNGPLMKLAPVVLAYASGPDEAIRFAGESARTTHGAPEAVDACRAFAALLLAALRGGRIRATRSAARRRAARRGQRPSAGAQSAARAARSRGIDGGGARRADSRARLAGGAALASTREPPEVRGGGYVIDALEAALWALRTTDDVRGRRAGRGQPRRRRRHDGRDLRTARGRDPRPRGHPRALARAACTGTTRSSRSRTRCYDLDVARPAIARFEHVRPDAGSPQCASPDRGRREALARRAGRPVAIRGGGHDFAGPLVDHRPADRHPPDACDRDRRRHRDRRRGRAARRALRRARRARAHGRRGLRADGRHRRTRARRRDRHPRPPARVHVRPDRSARTSCWPTARIVECDDDHRTCCGRCTARAGRASASSRSFTLKTVPRQAQRPRATSRSATPRRSRTGCTWTRPTSSPPAC